MVCLSLAARVVAQQPKIEDPAHWSYEAKKITADEYELTFRLKLDEPWHIWSLTPGGDGYEIIPSFTFDKGATAKDKVSEKGHAKTVLMDGMDNKVTYLSGDVEYKQVVKVKGDKVTGEHEYQVCNDNICLPPKKVKFEIALNLD
jgi:thiol:disulfide interchange protein DsbD